MEALEMAVEDNQTEQPESSSTATNETQKAAAPKFSKLTRFIFFLLILDEEAFSLVW